MIYFVVPEDTAFGIREYLELWGLGVAPRMTVLPYDELPRRESLRRGAYILSALDQLLPRGREVAASAADQLIAGGATVLNHPRTTLLRFELLEELFRLGLNTHRAARATGDLSALQYPVFLHAESHHTGALTGLLHTPAALQAELGRALIRGLRVSDLLVVEFCDTADSGGVFRKYAAFRVGAEIVPRGMARSTKWALKHRGSEFTRDSLDEERAYVLGNPHEAQLQRIFDAAGVGYGRIDYAVQDGRVRTWEINLNPTIGRASRSPSGVIPPEMQQYRAEAREYFYRRFQAAFEAIDRDAGGAPIPMTYAPSLLERLGTMARPAQAPRRLEGVKRIFRPFRTLLDPVLSAILPLLGRLAHSQRPTRPS